MSNSIPTNLQEIDEEFMQEIEENENGRIYQLLYAGIRMNRDKIDELIRWIKFMIPSIATILALIVAIISL